VLKSLNIKYLLFILFTLTLSSVEAQQLTLFSQYSEYGDLINAADIPFEYLDNNLNTTIGVVYRDQWTTLPDRPKTAALRGSTILKKDRGVGLILGGHLINDNAGVFNSTLAYGRIAGLIQTRSRGLRQGFSAGLNLGIGQYNINLTKINGSEKDPILFNGNTSKIYPDLGIGVNFYKEFSKNDLLKIGFSAPQIFRLNQRFSSDAKSFEILRLPHYYAIGTFYHKLSDDTYLQLSTWYRYTKNTPTNFDIIGRYKFSDIMWIGAGMNNSGIIHTELGIILTTDSESLVKVSYSFNPTFKEHSIAFGNIHELNLSYTLKTY